MPKDSIDLRQRRDLGDVISVYFEFFKKHLKPFFNVFIRYNGVFILGFLGASYLMVTGFVGTVEESYNYTSNNNSHDWMIGLGFLGFFGLFVITSALNYSLSAAYMILYQKHEGKIPEVKQVWSLVYNSLGKIILFVILACLIYVGVIIASLIVSIIPVVGFFGQYFIIFLYTAWMGVGFMDMLAKDASTTEGLGVGWNLVIKNIWKSILSNLSVGFLMYVLVIITFMIPGVLIGIYVFHSTEAGVDLAKSPVATIIWTVALCLFCLLFSFSQSVFQFVNGVLYYALHEQTYNVAVRERIEQIGARE